MNVSENGWSPISEIRAFFENFNSSTGAYISTPFTSINGVLDENYNIKKVDNMRESNGSRQYSLKLTKICDEAGNCIVSGDDETSLVWIVNYNYNVYSNTANIISIGDVSSLTLGTNIADDTAKNISLNLKDTYENAIIPVSWINREISFNITTNNQLKRNQYNDNGGSALYVEDQQIVLWTATTTLTWSSLDGNYDIPFYIYAPTGWAWIANLDNITFNTRDPIFSLDIPWQFIGGAILNSNITAAPLYITSFSWGVDEVGFREWATQTTELTVEKYNILTSTSNQSLRLEFGSGSFITGWNTNTSYNIKESGTNIVEWYQDSWNTLTHIWGLVTKNISTFMTQEGVLTDETQSYLASIVSYKINMGSDGTQTVVYPSAVVGNGSAINNTYQTAIKILWNTSSHNTQNLTQNQFQSDVRIFGNIEKSDVRRDIQKNVYSTIRSMSLDNGTTPYTVSSSMLNANTWPESWDGKPLQNGEVLYFGNLWNTNVEVDGTLGMNWVKTLVVEWGNIYIKWSIRGTGLLGLIALQKDGQWGNIYIDPSVTDIHAIIYADKSLLSYNGAEIDGNIPNSADILKNQLYIYGSVFSENTIGGSRKSTPVCPYYVNIACSTAAEAQKYDLNFLRRYFRYDSDDDGSLDTIANGGISANIQGKSWFEDYPVIIDYNSNIQETPPPFLY